MNARFWVWLNGGWVKLTLRPDQSLSWGHYRTTDEGFESSSHEWSLITPYVIWEISTRSRDCDGLLDRDVTLRCHVNHLNDVESPDDPSRKLPDWDRASSSQRDHTAEAAGY